MVFCERYKNISGKGPYLCTGMETSLTPQPTHNHGEKDLWPRILAGGGWCKNALNAWWGWFLRAAMHSAIYRWRNAKAIKPGVWRLPNHLWLTAEAANAESKGLLLSILTGSFSWERSFAVGCQDHDFKKESYGLPLHGIVAFWITIQEQFAGHIFCFCEWCSCNTEQKTRASGDPSLARNEKMLMWVKLRHICVHTHTHKMYISIFTCLPL